MIMKKRGVSPLIATILLIGFTVMVVILIIIWGVRYVTEIKEKQGRTAEAKLQCERDVEIDIKDASYSGNEIDVLVENKGLKFDGFVMRVFGSKGVDVKDEIKSINQGEVKDIKFEYDDSNSGDISDGKVEVIPKIRLGRGVYEACSSKSITYRLGR